MSLTIREATEADLPAIKAMMREFADYLNAIDEPEEVTDEDIDRIGALAFGPKKLCSILIAEANGKTAGYITYFLGVFADPVLPILFVADLFVREPYRRSNIGKALMMDVRAIARREGAPQIVWTVWRKNPKAIAFYEALGAQPFDEEILMIWPADPKAAAGS